MEKQQNNKYITHRNIGTVLATAIAICMALLMCGCSSSSGTAASAPNGLTAGEAMEKLEAADEIVLDKDWFSFGDHWTVYADGEHVADITGEFFKIWDVYMMRSTNGEIMCAEEENVSLFLAKAAKVDADGNEVGWYTQSFDFLLYKMEMFDANGNKTGSLSQNFNLVLDMDILDTDGNVAYNAKKAFLSFGAKITVTKVDGGVPVEDAIFAACIVNELSESDEE